MRLFAPDLYRNFGLGFVLGALLIVGTDAEDWSAAVASPARAAEPAAATAGQGTPAPTSDFAIAPAEG